MSKGKITIKSLSVVFLLTAVLAVLSSISVFAEPDETYAIESFVAETTTEATEETYPEETYTDEFTEEAETTEQSEATEAESTGETQPEPTTTEATEPSYRAPLPTVEDTEIVPPTVVGAVEEKEEPSLFWGFVSWILIGVGAAVIFAVMLSTKAKTYRGGRDRYSNTDKISGKKKLLPQDYYDKRKRR